MELQEIYYNDTGKDISINQDDYRANKKYHSTNRLPFTIDVNKDGKSVSLTVTFSREDGAISVHLLNEAEDQIVGRLILATPDIFPGAYYVSSMALLPDFQSARIGQNLYHMLLTHLEISLVGYDQSIGARKMWSRLSHMKDIALYAVGRSAQGNLFYDCEAAGADGYVYTNYAGIRKPLSQSVASMVVLTKRGSKMDQYINQSMNAAKLRSQTARDAKSVDPFAAHAASTNR